ncbi:MAG: DUF4342 domain-containing protein [Chloroflexota bacterium]
MADTEKFTVSGKEFVEKVTVSGKDLVEKVKEIIRQGNVKRIRLVHEGRPLIDIPLTVGASAAVVTVLAAPVLAAIAVIAALVTECTLEVEKIKLKKD